MNRTGNHHVKQNKPDSERQVSQVFSDIWNLEKGKNRHESKGGLLGMWKGMRRGIREGMRGSEYEQIHYIHVQNYHNETH
jgi:hypothetical protein